MEKEFQIGKILSCTVSCFAGLRKKNYFRFKYRKIPEVYNKENTYEEINFIPCHYCIMP